MSLTRPHVHTPRLLSLVDVIIFLGIIGLFAGLLEVAAYWRAPFHETVVIDLSPAALPFYTFCSFARGLASYLLSLVFTLVYGYAAAKQPKAERLLIPFLDVLQSVPILGFLPGVLLALISLFPHTNIGLELTAILMIFSSQAWNMTFSFYSSLRSIPPELNEAADLSGWSWWQRLVRLEVPAAMLGLILNSMMSVAGGWFFLMVAEAFVLGDHDFRLPGIGAYMSVAVEHGDWTAVAWAIGAMALMIVMLDALIWRPLIVWAQKFKFEETESQEHPQSLVLDWLRHAAFWGRSIEAIGRTLHRGMERYARPAPSASQPAGWLAAAGTAARLALMVVIGVGVLFGGNQLIRLLAGLTPGQWRTITQAAGWTTLRTTIATVLGSLWTIPLGVAIGRQPRLARLLQPVIQVVAAFPATMLFPLALLVMHVIGVELHWGAVVLMMLGTQWYILFNVIVGAMSLPTDLQEAADVYGIKGWRLWRTLILPGIFPSLVTGWETAAGGAWNASIVAEYVRVHGQVHHAIGLGALISLGAEHGNYSMMAGSVLAMVAIVVIINRCLWHPLYHLAETRFALNA